MTAEGLACCLLVAYILPLAFCGCNVKMPAIHCLCALLTCFRASAQGVLYCLGTF
jgi:hypothetical protein